MRKLQEEELKRKANEKVKTDIFKHTFVDVGGDINGEDYYGQGFDIFNKPPKDVFTFMNLAFDLPQTYY